MTKYGHGSVCQCGCSGAVDGVEAVNHVRSGVVVCSVQSWTERVLIVTFREICWKNGKYFVIYL